MNPANPHQFQSVVLDDGRTVTVMVTLNHLNVADDQGMHMGLAQHREALNSGSLVLGDARIRPSENAALVSFEGALTQAACGELACDNGDAQGFIDANSEQWKALALAGGTPAEIAKMLVDAD